MARLTIVLAAGGGSADPEPLAASLLVQQVEGVEVLTISDESADARNRALDEAAGDYVWFVERQDLLPPGSLAHVAERLEATSPDVLIVGHSALDARGKIRPGRQLAGLDGAVTLEQRPGLAAGAPRVWDKVFRRAHLRELGVRFGPGRHGGLAVTWAALVAAERIAAAPETGYLHLPPDAAAASAFDVFGAYEAVFAAVPPAQHARVAQTMLEHELSLLRRVPQAERREFFRRMSAAYRRHRTGSAPRSAGRLARVRRALVERDAYRAFRLLESARRRRFAIARLPRRTVARGRRARLDRYYRSRLTQPIDHNLAVYGAYWFRSYACNPRAIYEKARELVPDVRGVWVVRADAVAAIPPGVDRVVEGTREYFDAIARAGFFINNVNFPNHLVKREGTVHVMTHHGTPLKRMGLDLRDTPVAGRRMDFAALLRRCERWDYSVSSNEFSSRIWERVYPTAYESLDVGYPRNDALAAATEDGVQRIRRELGIEPGQTAVLYAPTHREWQSGYVPVLDLGRLAGALGPDHVVLARVHYFYESDPLLRELHRAGRVRDVASHASIEELCLAADVLVTDYSSLMFDYAVLDRPIVIHAPDWEVYRAMRGTYFDLMAEAPGVIARTEEELIDAVRRRTAWGEDATRARAAFRQRFCAFDDGLAAERVVRRLWLADREPPKRRLATGAR